PTIPTTSSSSPVVERETEVTKDMVHPTNNESTKNVQPLVVPTESLILNFEPVITPIIEPIASPVSGPKPNQRPSIPYPSRFHNQKLQVAKKLEDPGKFLIPCDFPEMAECLALADLGASINLMPLSVWNKLSLPDLSSTCMTLELVGRLISRPVGVAEDVFVKVGNYLPQVRKELKICEAKFDKSSINEPPEVELKDLPPHLEYAFLEGDDKFPVIIAKDLSAEEKTALIIVLKSHKRAIAWKLSDIKDQEKTTFTCPYGMFAYRGMPFGLCNAPGMFQRCMMAIFHDMIEKIMEVFMDDFSVFRNSFQTCLSHLEKMLKWCEDTNLCLNWEKSHFMVKEDIVLGHKTSKEGIEPMTRLLEKDTPFLFSKGCVKAFQILKGKLTEAPILIAPDWDFPFELMCDASDFDIGAVLRQRQEKHFRLIHYASKTMTEAESNYTTTEKEMLSVVYAFEKFRSYLIMNKSIVYTDHSALKYLFAKKDSIARLFRWVLLHQEFTFKTAGDHRKVQLNELNELNELHDQAYENSLIYKDKTKRLHDSKIKDRVFNIGDRVLLFNSRLKIFSGKLKSRWSGPFTISHVFPYGTVELSQPDGPNFKVNDHRLKHYFGEDVPKMVVLDLQTFPKDQCV
nr:DNA-directed DNA polymerase [Tanacetum cinerariifolium]